MKLVCETLFCFHDMFSVLLLLYNDLRIASLEIQMDLFAYII